MRGPRETRVREVRVIDDAGEALGIFDVREALNLAKEKGLDLIEVAPTAQPPVCKIGDYGRIKYEQGKREREQQRKQKHLSEIKDVRIDPRNGAIGENDLQVKIRAIQRFLEAGHKVKVIYRYIGRAITHPELGRLTLEDVVQRIGEAGVVERPPILEGKQLILILAPKS